MEIHSRTKMLVNIFVNTLFCVAVFQSNTKLIQASSLKSWERFVYKLSATPKTATISNLFLSFQEN